MSDILENTERKPMEFNLNMAQKILAKLKAVQGRKPTAPIKRHKHLYDSDSDTEETTAIDLLKTAPLLTMVSMTPTGLKETMRTQVANKITENRERRMISYDIITIKDAIHKANVESGVDRLLSQIAFYNAELAFLKETIQHEKHAINYSEMDTVIDTYFEKVEEEKKRLEARRELAIAAKDVAATLSNTKTLMDDMELEKRMKSVVFPKEFTIYHADEQREQIKMISKLLTQAENRLIELNSKTVVRVELSEPALENLGL